MPSAPSSRARLSQAKSRRARSKTTSRSAAHSKGAPRDALGLQTLQCFRTIFASARTHDAEVRRIAGIPASQLWALSEIERSAGMSVNRLSERMALHQTTASNLINGLVERKLVRRTRDEADQRVVRLHITTEGKRLLLRAPGPYSGLLVDALRHLEHTDLERLRSSLKLLLGVMRDVASSAAGETLLGE